MTTKPYMLFYPSDWRGDQGLRMCSLAARGLWQEMLGIMHGAEPYGYLLVNGQHLTIKQLSKLVSARPQDVRHLIGELHRNGVYSVSEKGAIYSRRMVRDAEKAERNRANGMKGGNPQLKGGVNPPDNGGGISPTTTTTTTTSKKERKKEESKRDQPSLESGAAVGCASDWPADYREIFWRRYPLLVGKIAAMKALDRVKKRGDVSFVKIITAVDAYAATAEPEYTKHPQTWINQGCWDDQPDTRRSTNGKNSVLDAADRLIERIHQFEQPAPEEQRRLCVGESKVVVLPIPERGRERPGDLRRDDSPDPVVVSDGNDPLRH